MSTPPPEGQNEFERKATPRSWGKTVIATLLVITFLVIIGGMFIPMHWTDERGERKASCGNNQRQIILSSMVYANDNDQLWPCRPTDAHGNPTMNPAAIDGFCTAAASLELLMVRNTDFPIKIFVCPSNTSTAQYLSSPIFNGISGITYDKGISQWGNNHLPTTAGGPGGMPYTYDWSAPTNTSAIRVMTTDRGNRELSHAHKNVLMAAAGDGHVLRITMTAEDAQRPPSAHVTMDLSGGIEAASFAATDTSSPNNPDDVYDDRGDDLDMNNPAKGSATRCWVR